MKTHILEHVPFEGPGSIGAWLAARRARVSRTRCFENPAFPPVDGFDLVVVMGGPMSVGDVHRYPWLATEKAFLQAALAAGRAVLGICLGAQLIAAASGARVYPNREKEIGWFPVQGRKGRPEDFAFPRETEVFHWHGDTFDLPPGARLLATSTACRNQGFQLGERVIGLQFHLETTPESLDAIIVNSRHELVAAPYIQTEARMRALAPARLAAVNRLMVEILEYLCPAS